MKTLEIDVPDEVIRVVGIRKRGKERGQRGIYS